MTTETVLPDSALRQWLADGRLPLPRGRGGRQSDQRPVAFEHDLLRLGFVINMQVREELFLLDDQQLGVLHDQVVSALADLVGQAEHRHLFLHFPNIVVDDLGYLAWRLWTWMENEDAKLGLRDTQMRLLEPCLHFVQQGALNGHGACPICQVPIDRVGGNVFMPSEHQTAKPERPLRMLSLISLDTALTIGTLREAFGRRTPLAEHELLVLRELAASLGPSPLAESLADYLNGESRVMVREALAQITGTLLGRDDARSLGLTLLGAQLTSATDVLRAVDVMGGGDGRLEDARGIGRGRQEAALNAQRSTFGSGTALDRARQLLGFNHDYGQRARPDLQTKGEARKAVSLPKLGRPLRRALLDLLEARPAAVLPEELGRHRRAWILLGERLHPLEDPRRMSVVAAFTALRGGRVRQHPSRFMRLPEGAGYQNRAGRLLHRSLQSDVEWAFRRGDIEMAWTLLATRPGQLGRSLERLVRASDAETLTRMRPVLDRAFARMTLPMLLSLRGHLRGRALEGRESRTVRVHTGRIKTLPALPPLNPGVVTQLAEQLTLALVALPLADDSPLRDVDLMQIDAGSAELMAPLAQRTASETLELVPAGSRMPISLPGLTGTPRLFVHWVEPEHSRVDLDLSAAFYSAEWTLLGACTFHGLTPVLGGRVVARHSGDLQSGPAPHGATEFVDLDLDALRAAHVRHVVITVNSYTRLPFEELLTCTSGVLIVPSGEVQPPGSPFRPEQVLQAAHLQGREQTRLTFALDLDENVMTYADLPLGSHRTLMAGQDEITSVLSGLEEDRRLGVRISMQELAVLQASRSAERVRVIHDQHAYTVRRQKDEAFLPAIQRLLSGDLTGAERSDLAELEPADVVVCRVPSDQGVGPNSFVVTPSPQRQHTGQPVSLRWLLDA